MIFTISNDDFCSLAMKKSNLIFLFFDKSSLAERKNHRFMVRWQKSSLAEESLTMIFFANDDFSLLAMIFSRCDVASYTYTY